MTARILVIDDDRKITSLLRRALTYEGYTVAVANDGIQGLQQARESPPDLVILDITMPGPDGLEVCRRLRAVEEVPIIMLTARDEVPDRVAGLDAGADDYVVKPVALEELFARVRAQLRRREVKSTTSLTFGDLTLDLGERVARRGEREIELTTKEFELLALFLRHPRQVLTRDLILERVWGYDFGGQTNVLDVYVGYLRTKLEASGESRLIQTVRGAGYVLREAT
ncbi:MAG: response regulator transcription factor [Chloroflexi bacterium]|nr:response regulator transcription factor [Chloroflexota bacterium]